MCSLRLSVVGACPGPKMSSKTLLRTINEEPCDRIRRRSVWSNVTPSISRFESVSPIIPLCVRPYSTIACVIRLSWSVFSNWMPAQ